MILSLAQSAEGQLANGIGSAVNRIIDWSSKPLRKLSNMFQAIGQAFIKMAAEMIAKQ